MKKKYIGSTVVLLMGMCLLSCAGSKKLGNPQLETGVSRKLAIYRKSVLSHISYNLFFHIPRNKAEAINASEILTFQLNSVKYPLQLDFKELGKKLQRVEVNAKVIPIQHTDEHLIIPAEALTKGSNSIKLDFIAGDGALNRNADYLYTLFVPDRARTVFPCFDQPDLKATYTLNLDIPSDWKAIANAKLKNKTTDGDRNTYRYLESDTISTYLFAFAAGKFDLAQGKTGSYKSDFLYRETDTAKINSSLQEIFRLHDNALKYLENWTGIPYPFQKFGFVAIPDFQFGGMEHVGNIQYKASALFLDGGATKDQVNARNNVIAHETAHMWFGDMVTMNWFTDVWMKEVFANFMADKSTEFITGKDVFDLKFLVDHFPLAYGVDRTTGSNPIRQQLDNLKDAGTMYGNIIYHKAPIMMRQLERLMGKDKFQEGVQAYLTKFRNGNASWPDLIGILDEYTPQDLQKWNKVWVNEPGRPLIDYSLESKNGKISKLTIHQKTEYGKSRIWPQLFELTLYYPGSSKELSVNLNAPKIDLTAAQGLDVPSFVVFNSSGQGYGVWPLDTAMFKGIYQVDKPVSRAAAYISIYENMLAGRSIEPAQALKLFVEGLSKEKEELNLKLITGYISNIYWIFTKEQDRIAFAPILESALWSSIGIAEQSNNRKILFKTYQDVYMSASARERLYKIWNEQQAPTGIKLTEDDYTSIAFSLALRDDRDTEVLDKQLRRITNDDRIKRFEFIMPSLSPDVKVRDEFFESLSRKSNREKEANVGAALSYLHHPLRQSSSIKYLSRSLEMLNEIQTTGDIFFPQNWLQSTLGSYQSKEAADIVRSFLSRNPHYNPKLKAKIIQTADNLFKAEQLLHN
ncbi:M1 family aminopeptidase [Pedobacter sp. PWIIR3]